MRLPKQVVRIVNAVTKLALLVGIPRPPYTPADQRKVLRLTGTIWVMRIFETSGLSAKLIANG
jgi:hypothetical protein